MPQAKGLEKPKYINKGRKEKCENERVERSSLNRSSLLKNGKIDISNAFISNNNNEKRDKVLTNNNKKRNNVLTNKLNMQLIHKTIHKSVDNGDNFVNKQLIIGAKFRKLWYGEMGQALTPYQEEGIRRWMGLTESGAPKLRLKSFPNVRSTAADQDVYDVAEALFSLLQYPLVSVRRDNRVDLTNE